MPADIIKAKIKAAIASPLFANFRAPKLSVVLINNDPGSLTYVRLKILACEAVGIHCDVYSPPEVLGQLHAAVLKASSSSIQNCRYFSIAEEVCNFEGISALIQQLNGDVSVDGILMQVPLPGLLRTQEAELFALIAPEKDVDGVTPENMGLLAHGKPRFVTCTPAAVMQLLENADVKLAGESILLIGRSLIVGSPLLSLLMQTGGQVTSVDEHVNAVDPDKLKKEVARAKIIISAVGKDNLVNNEWLVKQPVVVNVGPNDVQGPLEGVASKYTPKIGGVGPLTIANLLVNTLMASIEHQSLYLQQRTNIANKGIFPLLHLAKLQLSATHAKQLDETQRHLNIWALPDVSNEDEKVELSRDKKRIKF